MSGGVDETVRIWDLHRGAVQGIDIEAPVNDLALSEDGVLCDRDPPGDPGLGPARATQLAQEGLGLDGTRQRGSSRAATTIVEHRADLGEHGPVGAADGLLSRPGSSTYMRVRTTCPGPAPASARAVRMISRQRAAWASGSGSQEPSGQIGAVPETSTRSPTRTARLNPITGSYGDPEATRRRCVMAAP